MQSEMVSGPQVGTSLVASSCRYNAGSRMQVQCELAKIHLHLQAYAIANVHHVEFSHDLLAS